MIYGNINDLDLHSPLLSNPAWQDAFKELKAIGSDHPLGITQLKGEAMYMNVMKYDTLPRKECKFESHRKYVDLQYTICGSEIIEWRRSSELETDGTYDEIKDLLYYHMNESTAKINMLPGYFCIFYPSDAHLPRVTDNLNPSVYKVVIKVGLDLLNGV
jgi:YhcH/YjgK/YiaL family protein